LSDLNTTGYALLGLLAQHPWSAYDLTRFMRVSYLRAIWPRAESRLYDGAKKLVHLGYATAAIEQKGKRNRTIYSLTPAGRQALRAWLKTVGKDVLFEHEALLQLANCDAGELDDLQAIIAQLRASTNADLKEMTVGLEGLQNRDEQITSDKKFVVSTLVNSFVYETLQARLRWLDFAEKFTRDWSDLEPSEDKLAASRDHYRMLVEMLHKEAGKR
jgi:PadR family transcriptional regulator AphA